MFGSLLESHIHTKHEILMSEEKIVKFTLQKSRPAISSELVIGIQIQVLPSKTISFISKTMHCGKDKCSNLIRKGQYWFAPLPIPQCIIWRLAILYQNLKFDGWIEKWSEYTPMPGEMRSVGILFAGNLTFGGKCCWDHLYLFSN